ncbi:hypothetical protein I4U23_031215 [Adineta vaga]|nr:hypothetical protein I4U23_031215 [Adineta vaga]
MEAKLAEFRKSHVQNKPFINWNKITSIFSFSNKLSQIKIEKDEEKEETGTTWQIIFLKFCIWFILFLIFIRIEFGAIYFILSLLYLIWINLSSHRRRSNELSAYSKIQGDDKEVHCAIIVDNDGQIPLVGTRDYRHEHPLQHSTIVAIDSLSKNSFYLRENLLEKFLEKSQPKKSYLLNGCSIYLTYEPCIMCSMALLHSRISNVYYLYRNQQYGALGSIYKLHTSKKTNHRFNVYQLETISNDDDDVNN